MPRVNPIEATTEEVPDVAVVEVVAETGEAEPQGHAHPDTLQTLQSHAVTAIINTEIKLTTVRNPYPAPGSARSSPSEGPADLVPIINRSVTTPCFPQ